MKTPEEIWVQIYSYRSPTDVAREYQAAGCMHNVDFYRRMLVDVGNEQDADITLAYMCDNVTWCEICLVNGYLVVSDTMGGLDLCDACSQDLLSS